MRRRARSVGVLERLAMALFLLVPFGLAGRARADGAGALIQPGYVHSDTESIDSTGRKTHLTTDELLQSYRLSLDKALFQNLTLTAVGGFQKVIDWSSSDGRSERSDNSNTGLNSRLSYANPVLTAGLGYDRQQSSTSLSPSSSINEIFSFNSGWHAADLPSVDLHLSRTRLYDSTHAEQDSTVDAALLSTRYGLDRLDLRYSTGYSHPVDHVSGTETTSIDQAFNATYGDSFFDRRTTVYVAGSLTDRNTSLTTRGVGGLVSTQKFPVAGFSVVEVFPALPTDVTLDPNPAVIDGNTTASVGINIGFSPSVANDTAARDVGVQFQDVLTQVNTVYLWVDRQLPAAVAGAFIWEAYQSDDNLKWTPIAITAPVVFGTFQNRFELTLATTAARYLKVVTRPLPALVTTDRRFSEIFVTEAQFFSIVPASSLRRNQSTVAGNLNTTVTTRLLNRPSLVYDVSLLLARSSDNDVTTYTFVTGLSLTERLSRVFTLSSRVSRQDSSVGRGHEGAFQWGATLLARPLPTLYHALSYNGQLTQTAQGNTTGQSVGLLSRADLYEGISLLANVTASRGTNVRGEIGQTALVSASLSLTPNRFVSFAGTWVYSDSSSSAPSARSRESERIDASATFTPYEALYFSGSVSRVILGARPTTLASVAGTFSPLRGEIQLSASYSRSLDTEAQSVTQFISPTLRWALRSGVSLDLAYTILDSSAPIGEQHSRVFTANLLIVL